MKFFSTRDHSRIVTASQAIAQGLSDEGGLFVPESFPQVDVEALCQLGISGEVIDDLRHEAAPVDGIGTGKADVPLGQSGRNGFITEDLLHAGLGVVEIAAHGINGDICTLLRGHLQTLDLAGAARGVEHGDLDARDVEELAMNLLDEVRRNYPDLVAQRYKLDAETLALPPYELMEAIGRKRGLLVRGGEVNTERCAVMLVDEFRACKWGRISLERPPQRDDMADFAEEDEE